MKQAAVDKTGSILYAEHIPDYFSIFPTEALAILKATELAATVKKNVIVCSDSLSTINAVRNIKHQSPIINKIRYNITQLHPKLQLTWVPGHVGIKGNGNADNAAKSVCNSTEISRYPPTKRDFLKLANAYWFQKHQEIWSHYLHHYSAINPKAEPPIYPTTSTTKMNRCFLRLRLGHTKLTHSHLITKENPPNCSLCHSNAIVSIKHLTSECPNINSITNNLFKTNLSSLLKVPSEQNIKNVFKLLEITDLVNSIKLVFTLSRGRSNGRM